MNSELELYIHIPFCARKCNYCDFLSAPADDETKEAYVNALINEIKFSGIKYADRKITTIFIGGGTPSILTPDQIAGIAAALKENFDLIYGNVTRELLDQGLLQETEEEIEDPLTSFPMTRTRFFLTDKGIDVSNRVLAQFLLEDEHE